MNLHPHWYALNGDGDIVGLGRHEDFEDASDWADVHHPGCVWVVDAEGASSWYLSLSALLHHDKELIDEPAP